MGNVLLLGANGQVGREVVERAADHGVGLDALGRAELDLCDLDAVRNTIRERDPPIVINAAAYTAVDKAESDPATALAVNAAAPAVLAAACTDADALFIHMSTDYVFDGEKLGAYVEDDPTNPLGIYGISKLAGELAVRRQSTRHVILRTAWVYGRYGNNFVKTMVRLMQEGKDLRVVADQFGCPTAAQDIADAILTLCRHHLGGHAAFGTYHYCGATATNWHGFATTIAASLSSRDGRQRQIAAIPTAEYPTPARRPANSALDCGRIASQHGIEPRPLADGLAFVMDHILGADNRT